MGEPRLGPASPASTLSTDAQSMHTVSSSFATMSDDDTAQIDPFMFGKSPRTLAYPSSLPPSPPESTSDCYVDAHAERSPVRPTIHIRSRSWGVHQLASPAPKTPLPPIPGDTRNSLTTPVAESSAPTFGSSRPALAGLPSSRLVELSEIVEERSSTSGSSVMLRSSFDTDRPRSHSSTSTGERLDSFINFDHSSIGSTAGSGHSDDEEQLHSVPELQTCRPKFGLKLVVPTSTKPSVTSPISPPTPRRTRKLSKNFGGRHKRAQSTVEFDRLPSFRRGSSAESLSSNDDLVTPQDAPEQTTFFTRSHKRSSSWTRFKDRLRGLGGDGG